MLGFQEPEIQVCLAEMAEGWNGASEGGDGVQGKQIRAKRGDGLAVLAHAISYPPFWAQFICIRTYEEPSLIVAKRLI